MLHIEWNETRSQLGAELFPLALGTFVEESSQLLEALSAGLAEDSSWSQPLLADVLRKLHTLKGTTGQAGFRSLSKVVHKVEDLLLASVVGSGLPPDKLLASLLSFVEAMSAALAQLVPEGPNAANMASSLAAVQASAEAMSLPTSGSHAATVGDAAGERAAPVAAKNDGGDTQTMALASRDFDLIFSTLKQNLQHYSRAGNASMPLYEANQSALFALIKARIVPARSLVARLRKLVTTTAGELGKEVDFRIEGFSASIDRQLAQSLSEILTHMLRNSLDHALEASSDRQTVGKTPRGTLSLVMAATGDRTVVTVRDDGRGIDGEGVARKAVAKGVITANESALMTSYERQALIFKPGFSTKDAVSEVSGRGVGMDAVQTEVLRIGGKLTFTSVPGEGTEFRMEFPSPYQLEPMVRFRYQKQTYAVAAKAVRAIITCIDRIHMDFGAVSIDGIDETFMQLELRAIDRNPGQSGRPLLLLDLAGAPTCLPVDEILGVKRQLLAMNDRHQNLPAYLNGVGDDPVLGAVVGIDCTELERNLNLYMQGDDSHSAASESANSPQAGEDMNLQPTQLTGKFTSKEEVLAAIEGDHLMQRLREVLAQAAGNEALQNYLVEFAGREIDMFKDTVAEVDDISELQYMVAVRYASLKSQWILLNIKMQYQNAAGLPVSDQNAYSASILTLIIEALEPYANPTAIVQISQVLAEPLAKAS